MKHGAGRRIDQPRQQRQQRRLAAARRADDRHRLPGLDDEVDVSQDRLRSPYAKVRSRSSSRPATAGTGPATPGAAGSAIAGGTSRISSMRFHDADAALQHVRDPAERDHRPAEHHQVRVERHELADGDAALESPRGCPATTPAARRSRAAASGSGRTRPAGESARDCARCTPRWRAWNFASSADSCPYARTTRTPDRFSCATALSSDELLLDALEPAVDGAAEQLHRDRHERQRQQADQRQPRRRSTASG